MFKSTLVGAIYIVVFFGLDHAWAIYNPMVYAWPNVLSPKYELRYNNIMNSTNYKLSENHIHFENSSYGS